MKKNTAGQSIGVQMIDASNGSAFTGSVTVYVTGDAGTQAVGSVGSGACTHEGNGYHTYAPAQAETNYNLIAFTFIGTGAVPVTLQVYTEFNAANMRGTDSALTSLGSTAPSGWLDANALATDAANEIAAAIETFLVDDGDATAFLQAVADKIAGDLTTGDVTTQAIAAATRDVIFNRVLAGNHDTSGTLGALAQKLSVAGTLANTSNADTFKADISALATATAVAAVKAVLDDLTEDDAGVKRLTANAMELAPTGSAGGGFTGIGAE